MPDFPIVDTHVHLWDPEHFRMPWLDGNTQLNHRFDLQEYEEATAGQPIAAFVYLEVDVAPQYGLLEVDWVKERAAQDPRLQGIVAYAPVEFGEQARAYLDALVQRGELVKGIRRLYQGESDTSFCLRPGFVRGVQMLAEYGLSFDICITHHHLASTVEMVRRCPETSFILDHIGKPNIVGHELDPWREGIRALAELPNVICKVSGVTTEADHDSWTVEDIAPYIAHVLDCFGEDRVAFGGDWPVATLATTYQRWIDTLDQLTSDLSETAKRKLWVENASRFYRLGGS